MFELLHQQKHCSLGEVVDTLHKYIRKLINHGGGGLKFSYETFYMLKSTKSVCITMQTIYYTRTFPSKMTRALTEYRLL